MLFKLWIILNQIIIWFTYRETDDEYVEPHYFDSDFGVVCSVRRSLPRTAWHLVTNRSELFCSAENLFFDSELRPVRTDELKAGAVLATSRGRDTVVSCRCLNVRTNMYSLDVIAAPQTFADMATANGFVTRMSVAGDTEIMVRQEGVPVRDLVQKGPIDRLIEWIASCHVRLAARHLQ